MTDYTETTRKAVALALGWERVKCNPHDSWHLTVNGERLKVRQDGPPQITPDDLEALNVLAAETQGWTSTWTRGGEKRYWQKFNEWIDRADYTPTTDDGQAISLSDAVGWRLVAHVLRELCPHQSNPSLMESIGNAVGAGWEEWTAQDRPALLTAAAIIAAREL